MSFEEFRASLTRDAPPELGAALRGLWWDGKGDWNRAHQAAQEDASKDGCWVHAYLHRKEGDPANARYWYARAGRVMPGGSLEDEWAELVRDLLGRA